MIKFKFPDANTPGYLLRQKQYLEFVSGLDGSAQSIERIVDYLLGFVDEPSDKAREEVMNLSKAEYDAALQAIMEGAQVPPQK